MSARQRVSKLCLVITVLLVALLFGGCGREVASDGASGGTSGTGAASGGTFTVVTSFYPMYVSTINITKDIPGVSVLNMTKPQTGCLHDYSLKPDDLKTLESADVFVINGAGMEAFLDDVIKQRKDLKIIDASKGIELIKDENGVDNPHVWVSISDDILQVKNIADQLAALDGKNADRYEANAGAYIEKLQALKDQMHKELDSDKGKSIITFHEAFPYFAQEFGLKVAAVIEREPGSEPTPKELGDCIDLIRKSGIKALFAEPQYSSKAADAIARETGAKVYTLDPVVTGVMGSGAFDAYLDTMEQNMKTLKEALA